MKKLIYYSIIQFLLIFMISSSLYAESIKISKKSWYIPDTIKAQLAGNLGFLSLGVGYFTFNQHLETIFFYGYLPEPISGISVHTISLRNYIHPYMFTFYKSWGLSPYLSIGINKILKDDTKPKYPDGYYNNYLGSFISPAIGTRIFHNNSDNDLIKAYDFYFEVGTIDRYLIYYYVNETMEFKDILNFSVGVSLYF